MRTIPISLCLAIGLFLCPWGPSAQAQLGFCNGSSGDPIVNETFGTGTGNGPALPAGTTSYSFVAGSPSDGSYTLSSSTPYYNWHNIQDHTPNDTNGKCLVVNADYTAGEFYSRNVTGLCENTSYEFSSWLINLLPNSGCSGTGIPINVKFQIWDANGTNLLASGDTGNLAGTPTPSWQQYGLVFQTLPGQTSVILKMLNNGVGGCGNDLALDDIVFRTCGDFIGITDTMDNSNIAICDIDAPIAPHLLATPDFSIYSSHAYQWQKSVDGLTWEDIPGAMAQDYLAPPITTTTFYRAKVAEDPINLDSPLCSAVSEIFEVLIVPRPEAPVSNGDLVLCTNETGRLQVSVPDGVLVNWYSAPTGGNPLLRNSPTYPVTANGIYYAEAIPLMASCTSANRTAVSAAFYEPPLVTDEILGFCENEQITLFSGIENASYEWNTGETVPQITVSSPGTYTVRITNTYGCWALKTFVVDQIKAPIIEGTRSDDYDILVNMANTGDFEFSINGTDYQDDTRFQNLRGGRYTIFAREKNGCGEVSMVHIHFVVPKFFTPNGDNINDTFVLERIDNYETFEVNIFDRYGNLLKNSRNNVFEWDGTFRGTKLPAADYWYLISLGETVLKGHFTLKR